MGYWQNKRCRLKMEVACEERPQWLKLSMISRGYMDGQERQTLPVPN